MYLKGIDVSHHQDSIDWDEIAANGMDFAFAKASEGQNTGDAKFAENWSAMKKARLIRGAYEFFHMSESPENQAKNFIRRVTLEPGDLPPVVDIESNKLDETHPQWGEFATNLQTYLTALEQHYGVKPIIYTSSGYWNQHGVDTFGDYPLWVAHYTNQSQPRIPQGWSDWTFWQYSDRGNAAGAQAAVDVDRFNGDRNALLALTLK